MKKLLISLSILCLFLLCACNNVSDLPSDSESDSVSSAVSDESSETTSEDVEKTEKTEYIAKAGTSYIKGVVRIIMTEFVNPEDYEGDGPFDFMGVPIVKLEIETPAEKLNNEREVYILTLSPEVDTFEAIDALNKLTDKGVVQASGKGDTGLSWKYWSPDSTTHFSSPFKDMTENECKQHPLFVKDEITVCLDYELDLSEFEGYGRHYLFGILIGEISRDDSQEGFVYNIKYHEQNNMSNSHAYWVLEANEHVVWAEYQTTYGNGDVDQNGIVDINDCNMIKDIALGIQPMTYTNAGLSDVNFDGDVNESDYRLLKERISG